MFSKAEVTCDIDRTESDGILEAKTDQRVRFEQKRWRGLRNIKCMPDDVEHHFIALPIINTTAIQD